MRVLAFLVLLTLCCGYAMARGGRPEKAGAVIILAGIIGSILVSQIWPLTWQGTEIGLLMVDALMLLAFTALMLMSDRYWPIAITGLQLVMVTGHFLRVLMPGVSAWEYWLNSAVWSYPSVLLVAIGTFRHQQRQRAQRHSGS